jgi:hypothetical protein
MPAADRKPSSDDTSAVRSLISLALTIHLFCVAVVLASNFRRSPLLSRLVSIFAVYTQLLDFDPQFTPYYYTLGRPVDDDTWLAIDLYADAEQPVDRQPILRTMQLPPSGVSPLGARRPAFQMAKFLASRADAENENDDFTGQMARSIGQWAMQQGSARRAVVRCVRRMSQPYDLTVLNPGYPSERPRDPAYETTVYQADVWIDEDRQVQMQKRASRAEVAPRQSEAPADSAAPAVRSTNP